ncbi:hypothetical protein A2716_02545 [candidate division WWE3 bacterium RIFCSPHIGHO2_01_FULL_40_23]|uniref:Band 7 domain-containing protein n=1 Tax=candidate division WWE3 bacterium RIFCSPLOWO2_01_FULL_41_18 TaxID=1802625 RepID=A0A1F4VFB9_UNCKA|nr:MAG: hypothetical protein A2716_02545 [candidate division WWE3 bacterium RIFCSPHIGHO2_01_FULL_40_23]OGC55864.1 MAG: hypothetical protein A3A78_02395 [candidate division WWE3 bacterium RIFCSPLOWO2_01_FULL_41_18]
MKSKKLVLLLLAVVAGILLSACFGQATITSKYFKRDENYTTALENPELVEMLREGDLSADEAVQFADKWASSKYKISSTAQSGYEIKERLSIPYRSVGVLHVGPYVVVLPPRTYINIPTGDDELQPVPALCIDPGKIAWHFNLEGQREVLAAQAECYLKPMEGWTIEDALAVNTGQVAWRLKEDGSTETKTEVGVYPTEFLKDWKVENYLVVEPGSVAYRLTEDGNFEFRTPNPGVYPTEIESRWNKVTAVQIGPNEFGIYVKTDRSLVYLAPGVHYEVVADFVNVYPVDELRYCTLATDVYLADTSPESQACSSTLCGTIIDKIVISGTQRLAAFNVDTGFIFENPGSNPLALDKYLNLGKVMSAIRDYVEGPNREAVRSVGTDMTQQVLETEAGKTEFEQRVIAKVQGEIDRKDVPIKITYVNLRSRNFNDEDLRQAAAKAEVELQEENARIRVAQAQVAALEAETLALKALQEQIRAKMASVTQVVDVANGVSCTELALLNAVGVIEVEWDKVPKEMCQSGNTNITVTAP